MKYFNPFLAAVASFAFAIVSTNALAAEPIASTDGDISGARVEVTELKRSSGGTLTLKFIMYNDEAEPISFKSGLLGAEKFEGNKDYASVGGIHLIDAANRKKYMVVRDSEDSCVCSKDLSRLEPGSKINLWAKFPAPPEDVEKVSIIIPHFIPMDDVPIGK